MCALVTDSLQLAWCYLFSSVSTSGLQLKSQVITFYEVRRVPNVQDEW